MIVALLEALEVLVETRLTNEDFKTLRCDYCGKKFETYDKPKQSGKPDEDPYVDGGIISFSDDDGTEKHYHGYPHQKRSCWGKAHPDLVG